MLFDGPPQQVARVCVDSPLPHLDRLFDYRVPEEMTVLPGCRVKVRFAGRMLSGFVIDITDSTDFEGKLLPIVKVVSPEPVLTAAVATLARAVADRYAGNLADVLRLAVPPRHATVEKEPARQAAGPVAAPPATHWRRYTHGEAFLTALTEKKAPRGVWHAMPGEDWAVRLAEAAAATAAGGRRAILVVPDQRDLDRLDAALTFVLGPDRHVTLSAQAGPTKRYRAFLDARRQAVPVVAGTRAAAFAPLERLGLLAIWDDGDDAHTEPHAPYPHTREVLLTRGSQAECGMLVAGRVRSAQAQLLVKAGWASPIVADRQELRDHVPRVVPVGDDGDLAVDLQSRSSRLPTVAWQAAQRALRDDAPVLVQAPRGGYIPAVSCQRCRAMAMCQSCSGPLSLPRAGAVPVCRWCGRPAADHVCPHCGDRRLRSAIVGSGRTAEELGRTFPGVAVHTSAGDKILDDIAGGPAIVVATPGAEPATPDGYGAVLLLDAWALLARADLRAEEETVRRWAAAAALARPARRGGTVVVVADGGLPAVQMLVRWDPAWFAARELSAREEVGFPPAVRMASLTAPPEAVAELTKLAHLPDSVETLGPVPIDDDTERLLLRVPRRDGIALGRALHEAAAARSMKRQSVVVRVQVDPREIY